MRKQLITTFCLSFQELREVRVAFQLYEHEDMLGLVTDEHTLLRTLKVMFIFISVGIHDTE